MSLDEFIANVVNNKSYFVILDEVQKIYYMNSFWYSFKGGGGPPCYLLAFGVYPIPKNVTTSDLKQFAWSLRIFTVHLSYEFVAFDRHEFDDLTSQMSSENFNETVVNFIKRHVWSEFRSESSVPGAPRKTVVRYHPGLTFACLDLVSSMSATPDIVSILLTEEMLYNKLEPSMRCFANLVRLETVFLARLRYRLIAELTEPVLERDERLARVEEQVGKAAKVCPKHINKLLWDLVIRGRVSFHQIACISDHQSLERQTYHETLIQYALCLVTTSSSGEPILKLSCPLLRMHFAAQVTDREWTRNQPKGNMAYQLESVEQYAIDVVKRFNGAWLADCQRDDLSAGLGRIYEIAYHFEFLFKGLCIQTTSTSIASIDSLTIFNFCLQVVCFQVDRII